MKLSRTFRISDDVLLVLKETARERDMAQSDIVETALYEKLVWMRDNPKISLAKKQVQK